MFGKLLRIGFVMFVAFCFVAQADAALTHQWAFEEPNGLGPPQVLNTGTAGSPHGTFVNMDDTNRDTDVPHYTSTRSLNFNGTDERVDLATDINLGDATDFSVAFWYRGTESDTGDIAGHVLIGTNDGNLAYASFNISGGKALYLRYDGGYQTNIISTTSINNNQWHHIALVNDGDTETADLYVDGVAQVLGDDDSSIVGGPNGYVIRNFMYGYNNKYADGKLDDVRIYNTALTQAEISQILAVPEPGAALIGALAIGALARRRRGR